jgi:CubicO group peptidase (beta-lactamase class C family)
LAFDDPAPMKRDAIFRIASLTKLVTAVAAMILIEDCKMRLDDSIEPWLPELANRRVLKSISSEIDDTVPARRAITVRDLLTYRMGFGCVMAMPGTYPIQKWIREYRIGGDGFMLPSEAPAMDEWLRRLGSLPWLAQPGEQWLYHVSGDALGALIARVSGQSFGAFLRERIFEPLGMKDTGFFVPPHKRDRLATSYLVDKTGALTHYDGVADSRWAKPPAFEDGGAGLVSTVDDYYAFARMLLNHGKHGNEQILSRASVALMTTDQLTAAQKAVSSFGDSWDNRGWGFGVGIVTGRDGVPMTPGAYGWDGGYGTAWQNDPAEEAIVILMAQRAQFPALSPVYLDFWTAAYQAIED